MRHPTPNLFLNLALFIGAALAAFILVGAASLGLIAAWELRGYVETRQSTLGEKAATVLATGGEQQLIDWLNSEADVPDGVSIYVLDADSRDILGRELPEQYTDFVRDSVVGKPDQPNSNYRPVRLAPQLVGPDGKTYAFLLIPKGISLWGSPATAFGLLAVALLVIGSVAWLIARRFARPINELQLAVRELASGDTGARVPDAIAERGDELGALAADFNAMADRLSDLITGRETLLRDMSHELRSPLARLQAAIALAAEHDSVDRAHQERVEREIHRMNQVIGAMLSYASLDTNIAPRQSLVRMGELLRELIAVEELEARGHHCSLRLEADENLLVLGDRDMLNSGCENILRNAIRHAPENSAVLISARHESTAQDKSVVVTVSDSGPGVPSQHLQDIFEPYFRLANPNQHQDSTGLGLAIVQRVAEQHNGSVSASINPAGGLSVTLQLPAAELG